jgi:hypothetical protein
MTVKELIKKLEKVKDKELEVIIQGVDPTGWVYNNEVDGCRTEKVWLDEDDDKKTKVYIINGGIF